MSPAIAALPSVATAAFPVGFSGGGLPIDNPPPATTTTTAAAAAAASLPLHHAKSHFRVYRRSFAAAAAVMPQSVPYHHQLTIPAASSRRRIDSPWTPTTSALRLPDVVDFLPPSPSLPVAASDDDEVSDLLAAGLRGEDGLRYLHATCDPASVARLWSAIARGARGGAGSEVDGAATAAIEAVRSIDGGVRMHGAQRDRKGLATVRVIQYVRRPSLDFDKMQRTCLSRQRIKDGIMRKSKITKLKRCSVDFDRSTVCSFRSLSLSRDRAAASVDEPRPGRMVLGSGSTSPVHFAAATVGSRSSPSYYY